METYRLILPGDLNQYGYLFGGKLLAWIDEASWIAASLDYPQCKFVTVGMDTVVFRHSVQDGTILKITCEHLAEGNSSTRYGVKVVDQKAGPTAIFTTQVTFVSVDDTGKKRNIR